ncbi:hypothetical protein [Streptomyces chattanoogensis]|uniref:hypothetical protein n=1 Tax=Streptomyces chattanoogensis TaxID=66876 RepID=UPI0036B2BE39
MDGGRGLPSLGLEGERLGPGDAYLQRQVRAWSLFPLLFAVVLPWTWVQFAFADDLSKAPAVLAVVLTHAALVVVWFGRRRARRVLTWAGIGCYLLAVVLCVLLAKIL